jgi:hypothetical protein
MQTLMFAVGTPIANSQQRTTCVYFRPRQSTDKTYFKIQYGNGCSAHVSNFKAFRLSVEIIGRLCQRQATMSGVQTTKKHSFSHLFQRSRLFVIERSAQQNIIITEAIVNFCRVFFEPFWKLHCQT